MTADTTPFTLPESWEADSYGEHWSFAYATEQGERDDYDFRVELTEVMGEAEERAVVALIEAAPELLAALRSIARIAALRDDDENRPGGLYELLRDAAGVARAAIEEVTGRAG